MNHVKCGFLWTIEELKDGVVVATEQVHNLVPVEGLNYILSTALKNGAPFANFYVGLYENAYTPTPADEMATFPTAAGELTAYAETARRPLVLGSVAAGAVDNAASRAEFTGTLDGKAAMGGFIASTPTKGAASGVLISAVRFPSPRPLDAGTVLRVTAAFNIVSL